MTRVCIAIAPVNKYTHVQIWRARGWSYPHLKGRLLRTDWSNFAPVRELNPAAGIVIWTRHRCVCCVFCQGRDEFIRV
jgi:hypothetical protein